MRVLLKIGSAIQRCPLGLRFEKAHGFDILKAESVTFPVDATETHRTYILAVCRKSVEDAGRKNDQVVLLQSNSHPPVGEISDIEETFTVQNVSYLFIFM